MRMGALTPARAAWCWRMAWAATKPASTPATPIIVRGSTTRRRRTRRLWARAFPRGGGPASGVEWARSLMGEDVDLLPAGDVQGGARRQELETGLRKLHAPLAFEHRVESRLYLMKALDIRGGVR